MINRARHGQTLVEYGLLLSLIATIVIVALLFLGPIVRDLFTSKIEIDGKTFATKRSVATLTIDGQLYVSTATDCLAISGDTINVDGVEYVEVGPGDSVMSDGQALFLSDPDCLAAK